jgi:hypothetical protein
MVFFGLSTKETHEIATSGPQFWHVPQETMFLPRVNLLYKTQHKEKTSPTTLAIIKLVIVSRIDFQKHMFSNYES